MPSNEEELIEDPPTTINPYEVLGLSSDADGNQVKSAYRKKALKHHPGMLTTFSLPPHSALAFRSN
jgi:DnaJ homolog subfamily C member 9